MFSEVRSDTDVSCFFGRSNFLVDYKRSLPFVVSPNLWEIVRLELISLSIYLVGLTMTDNQPIGCYLNQQTIEVIEVLEAVLLVEILLRHCQT